jgi:Ca2+-binding EF-hand superfamily protein
MSAVQENFAGIDFDEIKEATALEFDEIKVLKLCFNLFDVKKQDFLGSDDLVKHFTIKDLQTFLFHKSIKREN